MILVLEKEVAEGQIRAVGRLSHLGDLIFHQKFAQDMMYKQAY